MKRYNKGWTHGDLLIRRQTQRNAVSYGQNAVLYISEPPVHYIAEAVKCAARCAAREAFVALGLRERGEFGEVEC